MTIPQPTSGQLLFEAARRNVLADLMTQGWIGRRLGPYRIVASVGSGGMGAVYCAERDDGKFRKQVAVKLIRPELVDAAAMERFRNERQLLADLEHPNIARLLDGGETPDGASYIVMEYVEGEPVTRYCAARKASIPERLMLFQQLCAAVAYSHAGGIVHCDLKPANTLVTAAGHVKLVDFGIARRVHPGGSASCLGSPGPLTPDYASPEQVRGDPLTPATDVYSLGAVLHELLTGVCPDRIESRSFEVVPRAPCEGGPNAPGLDAELDRILLTALATRPADRYPSVECLSDDIQRYLAGQPVRAIPGVPRQRREVLFGVAFLFAAGGAALIASRRSPGRASLPEFAPQSGPVASRPIHRRRKEAMPAELRSTIGRLERAMQAVTRGAPDHLTARAALVEHVVTLDDIGAGELSVVFRRKPKAARQNPSRIDGLAHGHASLGFARLAANWDWTGAERDFREAIRLRPGFARAWAGYTFLLMKANRLREAAEAARRLHGLEPVLSRRHVMQAQIDYRRRDFTAAAAQIEASLGRGPGSPASHYLLAVCYGYLHQPDRALAELGKANLLPEIDLSTRAWLYGTAGRTREANAAVASCRQSGGDCLMALIGLGRREEAFAALRTAVFQHSPVLLDLRSDPRFDPLRADPRFAVIERRVGFRPAP